MRIGLYADTAKDEQPRGIGLHVVNLVKALGQIDSANTYLLYYRSNLFARSKGLPALPRRDNFEFRPIRFPRTLHARYPRAWWDYYLPAAVLRDRVDLFHGPNHFLPAATRCKQVVTIHDLAHFKMDLYSPVVTEAHRYWTERAIERADMVIAISECTRQDVLSFGADPGKVRVVYSGGANTGGARERPIEVEQVLRKFSISAPYILFVGTLHPRKNVPFLVKAFHRLVESGLPHTLVLAGVRDSAAAEIDRLIEHLGLGARVTVTGYVSTAELDALYGGARLFMLPSRYEGFGMILHEAMLHAVPIVASNTSSVREVVGDRGAVLVEPDNIDELAIAMRNVLLDDNLHQALARQGLAAAARFSWQKCATETLALYEEVYEERSTNHGVAQENAHCLSTLPGGLQPCTSDPSPVQRSTLLSATH